MEFFPLLKSLSASLFIIKLFILMLAAELDILIVFYMCWCEIKNDSYATELIWTTSCPLFLDDCEAVKWLDEDTRFMPSYSQWLSLSQCGLYLFYDLYCTADWIPTKFSWGCLQDDDLQWTCHHLHNYLSNGVVQGQLTSTHVILDHHFSISRSPFVDH